MWLWVRPAFVFRGLRRAGGVGVRVVGVNVVFKLEMGLGGVRGGY